MELKDQIVELYRRTATELPQDIVLALENAMDREESPVSKEVLSKILDNINIAKDESRPICQDTGVPIFYIECPAGYSNEELIKTINEATITATEDVPLRPNAMNSLTDENLGNKPIIHFEEGEKLSISLMLKGGGSENVSAIYQLPNQEINAPDRNLEGVRKCILDAVFKAQGKGCPPYIIGVAIGGNIEQVSHLSKKQLLRKLDDNNPELKEFENNLLNEINQLGIGPLGLGGKTTALGVKAASAARHPASFFVGISIGCWCLRRQNL